MESKAGEGVGKITGNEEKSLRNRKGENEWKQKVRVNKKEIADSEKNEKKEEEGADDVRLDREKEEEEEGLKRGGEESVDRNQKGKD